MKKLFIQFLRDNKAYSKYDKAIKNYSEWSCLDRVTVGNVFDFLSNERSPMNILVSSFVWGDTPQGELYWRDLNSKWKKIVMEENIGRI